MLQLTKRTEYGLIALTVLASRAGQVVSAREIARAYPVPRRLLAEVLKDLGRGDLVVSHRGANGGYALSRPAEEINVAEIVGALEGIPVLTSCGSPQQYVPGSCDVEAVCPIRSPIQRLRIGIWDVLERMTLRELCDGPGGRRALRLAALDGAPAST